ncbi:MAG: hypothetical protein P8171_21620 [Candidatus Thiodiazotropha sp.]
MVIKIKKILLSIALPSTMIASPFCHAVTPTYTVYFDGGGFDAGSLVIEHAADMPEGACGLRVSEANVLEYYWSEYNAFGMGSQMSAPPLGPPNSSSNPLGESLESFIEFTGPYGENCGEETIFHGPMTGDYPTFSNGTPEGAGSLVFQVLPDSVEWLTESFTPWEPNDEPINEEDPDPVSVCEIYPDLCIEPKFTTENPCDSNIFECHSIHQNIIAFKQAVSGIDVNASVLELRMDKRPFDKIVGTMSELSQSVNSVIKQLKLQSTRQSLEKQNRLNSLLNLTKQSFETCERNIRAYPTYRTDASKIALSCTAFKTNANTLSRETLTSINVKDKATADFDCITHDDKSMTCLKEGAWICYCDAPNTSGGSCECISF